MIEYCPYHEPRVGTGPLPTMGMCENPFCRLRTWLAVTSIYGLMDRQHLANKLIYGRTEDHLTPLVARLTYRTISL